MNIAHIMISEAVALGGIYKLSQNNSFLYPVIPCYGTQLER